MTIGFSPQWANSVARKGFQISDFYTPRSCIIHIFDLPVSTVHTGKEWSYNNGDVGNNGRESRTEMENKKKEEGDGITMNRKQVILPPFI